MIMNKYEDIDAVYPPYTKETQLLTEESVQLLHDSKDATAQAVEKSDSSIHKYLSTINKTFDEV